MTIAFEGIDESSAAPPYEQLRMQVVAAIADGRLAPGDRLPSVRALASEIGLAANTVARAYRELEVDGHVVTAGRNGTHIAERELSAADEARALALTVAFLRDMQALGIGPESIEHRVAAALRPLA
ncbi:GntR family transcriptional regulator [Gulosibacter sp. ACHW.36C]|jgi:DNA-binding transcriptional regulator YhcF (GntR family)|uniref:GntR family transcriptional regulator n=1 Tax=Gulosibacter sediminis TaxID=1729695 RepID=A0ABY4MUX4_9MICO|nr:GntR family transcriptional regulator [Gulosibacter sediminis]UQN14226.1 GntR family transcriptional regulator [Gulosibacter sediminis]